MMVTGKMPFDGCGPLDAWMKKSSNEFPAPRQLVPELSERIDSAIRRAMSASPEARPASCREFIEDVTGQSTRLAPAQTAAGELWYMFYKDEEGENHTVKGTAENIRKAYQDGLLGDASNIRAARTKQGPFQPLHTYGEFRDLDAGVKSEGIAEAARETIPETSDNGPAPAVDSNGRNNSKNMDATIAYTPTTVVAVPKSGPIVIPGTRAPLNQFDWKFWVSVFAIAIGLSVLIALYLPKLLK
jgi:hypothetical protein